MWYFNQIGSKAQIGICGFTREKVNECNIAKIYLVGIPIEWPSGKRLRVATSSYAGEIQAACQAPDTALFLGSKLA